MSVMRAALPFLLSVALAPVTRADMFRPSVQDQIKLGKRGAEQVTKEEKVLPDSDARVKEVRRLGESLVSLIPTDEKKKRPFEYSFDVIEKDEVNAFALPGGPIYIYSGLLDKFTTEDEVLGVLAHEITHVRNQHWASAYADNTKRRLGITAVLILFGAGDTAFNVAGVADTLLFTLPYSRKHETESDDRGYDLVAQLGFNPMGMANSFEILKKEAGSSGAGEFLASHPDLDKRIKRIKDRIAKSGKQFPAQRPRQS